MTHCCIQISGLLIASMLIAGCDNDILLSPISQAGDRATPLSFGLYVTPEDNPIDPPERFTGYHTALDFEITTDELEADVPVHAICNGEVIHSDRAEGYGGLLVQRCSLLGETITVLYGHLDPDSLPAEGTRLKAGQTIGQLAPANSYESGYTRKHLHLGISKGPEPDFRGYVQTEAELDNFIDPAEVLPLAAGSGAGLTPYWEARDN